MTSDTPGAWYSVTAKRTNTDTFWVHALDADEAESKAFDAAQYCDWDWCPVSVDVTVSRACQDEPDANDTVWNGVDFVDAVDVIEDHQ